MPVVEVLKPAVVLVLWTLVVWLLMLVTRIPAVPKAGISLADARFSESMRALPAKVRQVADNYNHLMEQPTVFYAVVVMIAVLGKADFHAVVLSWGFVVTRILHSLIQITVNRVELRLPAFLISSLFLAALAVRLALAVF